MPGSPRRRCLVSEYAAQIRRWRSCGNLLAAVANGAPTEFNGKWHGHFPKRSAAGMHIDASGGLWSSEAIASGQLPKHYRIVGVVPA